MTQMLAAKHERRIARFMPAGSHWVALCPFHAERNPSCALVKVPLTNEPGEYHCFGCKRKGRALLRRHDGPTRGMTVELETDR